MTKTEKLKYLAAIEEKTRRLNASRLLRVWSSLYPWQRRFNAATAEHRACMLMAANRVGKCVDADTLVDTPDGPIRIVDIKEGQQVYSFENGHIVLAKAEAPFSKGEHPCYRLECEDGWFIGADFHRVLVSGHWLFLEELHALYEGHQGRVADLLRSSLECDPLAHALGEEYLSRIAPDCLGDCSEDFHQYGEPLHGVSEFGRFYSPSQADALKRILLWYTLHALAHTDSNSLLQVCDHLSTLDDPRQISAQFVEFLFQAGSKLFEQWRDLLPAFERLSVAASPDPQSIGAILYQTALELLSLDGPCLFSFNEGNKILSCRSIGGKEVFDMTVPETGNYIAAGFVHHNTRTGLVIDAFHLTGDYPEDWDGHRFEVAPMCWLLGFSGEKTRDLLQNVLFGRLEGNSFEGGLIAADRIIDHKSMTGTSGACREVRVRHKSGGISTCQFWSYSQGQHAIMGDSIDWYHIDEEPKDNQIVPQVMTRTVTGDKGKGGRGILTFTPENGKTQLVTQFMDFPEQGMYLQTATWDDAPHLSEDAKREILALYPESQRAMRTRGVPLMGAGLIFEHAEADITCPRFEIPDHFYLINGMDFGWDHPQAHVQLAIDPDSATIYVVQAWKKSKKQPWEAWQYVKHWAAGVPTAWPHDGLQTEKGSAKQQKEYYEEAGWEMIYDHATWKDGGTGVEAGLMELNNLMLTGKFKIFKDLYEVVEEIREYHRAPSKRDDGMTHIVKLKDDLISACFHADTEVMTAQGRVRIADLVGTEGMVLSVDGRYQDYRHCRMTRKNAEVVKLTFNDGHTVICTPDHKFLTANGWRNAICLRGEEVIMAGDYRWGSENTLRVLQIESAGKTDVYCMEVPETEAFALANGAIVHNCRYAYMMAREAVQKRSLTHNHEEYEEDDRRYDIGAGGY